MLVPKKTSLKKTAVYVAILVLTLAATAFIVSQIFGSAARAPVVLDNLTQPAVAPSGAGPAEIPAKAKIAPLDLSIFSNPKFSALESMAVPPVTVEAGKRDPFRPN